MKRYFGDNKKSKYHKIDTLLCIWVFGVENQKSFSVFVWRTSERKYRIKSVFCQAIYIASSKITSEPLKLNDLQIQKTTIFCTLTNFLL